MLPVVIALVVIAVPWILRTVFRWLKSRAAKELKVVVTRRKNQPAHHGHYLDLRDEFLEEMDTSTRNPDSMDCRMMSLATYTTSLEFDKSENSQTDVKIALTLLKHILGNDVGEMCLPLLPTIGKIAMRPLLDKSPTMSFGMRVVDQVPSLLLVSALVDVNNGLKIRSGAPSVDCCGYLIDGEEPNEACPLPEIPANLVITGPETIDALVNQMNLGPDPDKKHYATPRPFAPDLLPGLCLGSGGLTPYKTPRELARDRVFAAIFNKLCGNVFALCGYRWASRKKSTEDELTTDTSCPEVDTFSVTLQDGPNGKPLLISTPWELADILVQEQGFDAWIQTNYTSFGVSVCLLDADESELSTSGTDSTNPADRKHYVQIPFTPIARTGISPLADGDPVQQVGIHASFMLRCENSKYFGNCVTQFYTGQEGFTGFHGDYVYNKPWVNPVRHTSPSKQPMGPSEIVEAIRIAALYSVLANITAKKLDAPVGGYGSIGVCNDSVAVIEQVLYGQSSIFPLLGRSVAKSAMLAFAHAELQPRLSSKIISNFMAQLHKKKDHQGQMVEQVLSNMNTDRREQQLRSDASRSLREVVRAVLEMEEDLQIRPEKTAHALERMLAVTPEDSALEICAENAKVLKKLRTDWCQLVSDYQTSQ